MKGFAVGSLVLIGLYVGFQSRGVAAAAAGGNWFVSGLRKFLAPDVPGVPTRGGAMGRTAGEQGNTARRGEG